MIAKLDKPEDPENVPADWYEGRMRVRRNLLLTASDFSQLEDAPVDKNAWAAYRQQLRDFPATWTPGPIADFPDPPA
jgi:hypothetical protein